MESKINYTLVGAFVSLLLAGLLTFAFWLGKYGGEEEYDHYYVYFSESVAGLSNDTSVKYNGVDVGSVEHMGINMENPEEAELLLRIKHGTPVKVDTKAKLKSFGITGLVFIELTESSKEAPLLLKTGDNIPVIQTSPSTFAQIDKSLDLLAEKFDRLLSEENLNNITALLSETTLFAKEIRGQLQGFRQVIDNGIVMEKRMTEAFGKVEAASVSVKKLADSLDKNYAGSGSNMQQDVRRSLEYLNQLLYELDILAGDMQRTIRATEASPSDLLFKQSQPRPGPGEEGYHEK
ncbi:phospholipid/cholesterol/gamma-HCH transport system substrate-binding protein [Mariprofundus ferrinatatus]|uniref:Phospholipid/cholesterol/gamma-HCH transport system substrate-binding protein n=1 Tax=Mariprofundus ferrinatatus TaxID=1921087 RepID=A0A2K8L262_9PROT|nr:MlaD family protein [Mariprofundus ferrinatatus]ATX81405.1 phospholipid/cholesterol/gamma-HCH transport system substrate-binding protein [Mariprofundus ferrinatatus]